MNNFFTLGVVCLLFVGCATAPAPRQIVNAFQIDAPFDKTWSAVVEVFAELNFTIDNLENDSGLITTGWLDFSGSHNKHLSDCGGMGITIEVNKEGKFNVFVKPLTETTSEIKINCVIEQTVKLSDIVSRRKCVSTGVLEKDMYDMVIEKLSGNVQKFKGR